MKVRRDSRYIYTNELGKHSLQHDMAYGDFKDLPGRMAYDKVLHDKAFKIASNPNYDHFQQSHQWSTNITSMVYKFFDNWAGDTSNRNKNL